MSKNKLQKFSEMETFERVFQPRFEEVFGRDYHLRGRWAEEVFENSRPIVLELGCGKGEYTVGLAERYPEKNFIGVDIKGARIWRGARTANERKMLNVAFLRTRIEVINSFFGRDEVEEIWITFPDPQLKKRRNKKRLTGALFLNRYRQFLKDGGLVHLKTDNGILYSYTRDLVIFNKLEILRQTEDLYQSALPDEVLSIQTFYERQYLNDGVPIKYISFRLPAGKEIIELRDTDE